jgi:hypothetical protein
MHAEYSIYGKLKPEHLVNFCFLLINWSLPNVQLPSIQAHFNAPKVFELFGNMPSLCCGISWFMLTALSLLLVVLPGAQE